MDVMTSCRRARRMTVHSANATHSPSRLRFANRRRELRNVTGVVRDPSALRALVGTFQSGDQTDPTVLCKLGNACWSHTV